ncbi:MAG: carboxypeptidase regulatory-like domain-containing protein [Candidatus Altiarchaeota archaeon]|nr:carboxypeptidase regulatory-like domain-containing protein [Candidatus Altiarchaeota archaeon]
MIKRFTHISLILLLLASIASAAYIDEIETKPKDIDPNGEFTIKVYLGGETCGIQMKIYVDDKLFSSKNIGCENDEVETNEWDLSKDILECGVHKLQVDLIDSGSLIQTKKVDLNIGNAPQITISPKEPIPNAETTITFKDRETGKLLSDIDVRIFNIRDGASSAKEYSTNNKGEIKFISDSVGDFRLTVEDPKYCGTLDFWIRKTMPFAGPFPEDPVVGERIGVAVPAGVGVKYIDSEGNVYPLRNLGGGVNLTINEAGDYTLIAGDVGIIYWRVVKNFTVSDKSRMSAKIEPEKAVTNKVVLLTVTTRGEPISNTPVKITKPIGGSETLETNANGEIRFTPETVGTYHYKVEKQRYETLEGDVSANNAFTVEITPYEPTADEDITLNVTNQLGNRVDNAMVYIEDSSGIVVTERTGFDGSFKFRLSDPREYTIRVQKEGFWDLEDRIRVYGVISIKLCPNEMEIGDEMRISITDNEGMETPAGITVTKPDGRTETIRNTTYKPARVGVYTIEASKTDYRTVSAELTVNPHPIEVTPTIVDNNIIVVLESHDKPVSGLTVLITTPNGEVQALTDENGIVKAPVNKEGNLTISVNNIDTNDEYENLIIRRRIAKQYDFILLILPVFFVIIVTFLTILVIEYFHRQKKKTDKGEGLFHGSKETKTSAYGSKEKKTSLRG